MANPAADQGFSDVRKVGYLRKPKSMHKRFFVLRIASASGPSRLEYYENEKKWRHKSVAPKRSIPLESCFNINKRADSKNKYLVALYTKEEYFAVAADNEQEQDMWYQALLDLHNRGKLLHGPAGGGNGGTGGDSYGAEATPGPAFKEVWQVVLKPKGLGHAKNLIGIYRLCLTNKTISLVKLNSDAAAVVLQLMNIRRCGHSESFFFVEVGRSAITGPGEFWMQADDSVVAQNMHETILEAMKAMSEEFHPRSKSQGSSNRSTPISVPLRRHHHHGHAPPSQVGLGRRSRAESAAAASPAAPGRQTRSFRVRASSDGEGTMSRPASADGSPVSPSSARGASSQRRRTLTSARLHPPLTHSRSIPTPSSTTSPVSLSSCSSTSGHGSASDCPYPRRPSATPSGSPSDGGFVSSDEYGSSPGDFRGSSFRSATPDSSLGHTPPPAREEELNNYIYMARPGLTAVATATAAGRLNPNPALTRRLSPPHLEELEKSFRKRTHTPPPASTCHQKTPSQSSLDEYAAMTPGCRHPDLPPVTSYPGEMLDLHVEHGGARLGAGTGLGARLGDDGYMPMSPGAAPASSHKSDDYMPMSPKTVSAPQQILGPRSHCRVDSSGYMMMSPENGGGGGECVKAWSSGGGRGGANPPEGKGSYGDYISMSPGSSSATSTPPPDCYLNPPPPPAEEAPPTPGSCYYSLPRSYRHAPGKQSQLRVALGPGRPAYPESSSSSASSDSLGPQDSVGRPLGVRSAGRPQVRPTRLSLDCARASTLPRARDSPFPSPEPHSPGEYVSMEFGDRPFGASLASLLAPVFTEDSSFLEGGRQCPSEYGNLELEAGRTHPGFEGKDFALGNLVSVVPGTGPALGTLSAFSRVRPNPDQNQGARVVRVDPQARQRHGSGTFGPELGGRTTQPQLQASQEGTKLHSCSSFEDVWPSPRDPVSGRGERAPVAGTASSSTSSSAHNLNYMDLDLGKVLEQSEWSFIPPECPQRLVEPPTEEGNGYASVSFRKPERANTDPSHREE